MTENEHPPRLLNSSIIRSSADQQENIEHQLFDELMKGKKKKTPMTTHDSEQRELTSYVGEDLWKEIRFEEKLRTQLHQLMSTTYYTSVDTSIGRLFVAFKGASAILQMVSAENEQSFLAKSKTFLGAESILDVDPPHAVIEKVQSAVEKYSLCEEDIDLLLLTPLQKSVLSYIQHIPCGEVRSYAEIARAIGRPSAAGAIARALAKNPFPIIIPCHRVVCSDGALGHYASAGKEMKKRLLQREGVFVSDTFRVLVKKIVDIWNCYQNDMYPYLCSLSGKSGEIKFPTVHDELSATYERQGKLNLQQIQSRYVDWLIERYETIDVRDTLLDVDQLELDKIYVPLRLCVNMTSLDEGQDCSGLSARTLITEEPQAQLSRDCSIVYGLCNIAQTHNHIVMLGAPGSGKTTMLRHLALTLAQQLRSSQTREDSKLDQISLPIPIQLTDYAKDGLPREESLKDFLVTYFAGHGCPTDGLGALLETRFAEGRCVVMLDGLDEVSSVTLQLKLVQQINQFISYHSDLHNQFIVTSRVTGYYSYLSRSFTQCTIEGMNTSEVVDFIRRWNMSVNAKWTSRFSPKELEAKRQQLIDVLTKIIHTTHNRIMHSNGTDNQLPITPLLVQVVTVVYCIIIQRRDKSSELSQRVTDEYLASLLSRVVYSQYLSRRPKDFCWEEERNEKYRYLREMPWHDDTSECRFKEDVKRAIRSQTAHEHPSTSIEEIIHMFNEWTDFSDPWSKDSPDLSIREEVRELLLDTKQQTDRIVMSLRRIIVS